ncbi:MAG: hydantoinase B/oxoprolinase family protein [Novosphingobium sp.]|nr:hydantoinase B/oxoprolinase family protein [Novosphingobium sp.]
MNVQTDILDDPIVPEILRTRLEAIGQEAGAAVEQTAISPIVTESKDYSVTILDADGSVLSGSSAMEIQFGVAMHCVRTTIEVHGESIADGDLFIANDPHSGGGVHPQDVVIQKPVFLKGRRVAWVALTAHMMDMGGMVPGSSAVKATECYQEALRLPPVRLIRRHEEVKDIWNLIATNIRSADYVEMDIRSLVIGGTVAARKIEELVGEMGLSDFRSASRTLLGRALAVLRERIGEIEDGFYASMARVEYQGGLLNIPCSLTVAGDRLIYDFSEAPPQVPHFFNSKAYILRAIIGPRMRELVAPGLPINQALYDVIEIVTKPGTLVDSVMPAPIAAAHMDAAMAVDGAAWQCLQLAIHASPGAAGRRMLTAPAPAAYGVGRWNYLDNGGQRRVYTVLDGAMCGSSAGHDRSGIDLKTSMTGTGSKMELADVEVLEAAYPILFRDRGVTGGKHGYGRHRSGAGCCEAFQPHLVDSITGNLTGTKAWFPAAGAAGGHPGATIRYRLARADGSVQKLDIKAVGVTLEPGDHFELHCASGGGFGDPLDRDAEDVSNDLKSGRIDATIADDIYGVAFSADGEVDRDATAELRDLIRSDRLKRARPAQNPAAVNDLSAITSQPAAPLYPGVIQHGDIAVAEKSGAPLAVSPGNWLDGCPILDTLLDERGGGLVMRAHLDPLSGRILFADVLFADEGPSMEVRPQRWASKRNSDQGGDSPPIREWSEGNGQRAQE